MRGSFLLPVIAALGMAAAPSSRQSLYPSTTRTPSEGSSDAQPVPLPGVRIVVAPDRADVAGFVAEERARAIAQRRRVVVYVGADWCQPCETFRLATESHRLDRALPELTLLEFDLDLDGPALRRAGYAPTVLPSFWRPGADGRATGEHVEGSIEASGSVDSVTRALRTLLHD